MNDTDNVRRVAPERLSTARDLAHKAVQMVSKAARANLAPVPDDSHSNLGWDRKRGAFLSQPIEGMNGAYFIGFAVSDFELIFTCDGDKIATRCIAGDTDADAADWLDAQLANTGLEPTASTTLPYDLPASVERIGTYEIGAISEDLKALTSWFMLADKVLVAFAEKYRDLEPRPGPLRCWPHHFDLSTDVSLEEGDFETARRVGVGISPGDESYDEPYFYISPSPHLNLDSLPQLPAPGHWHTQGFVGAIATATEVLSMSNISNELPLFIDDAFTIGRKALGI